MTFMLVLPLPLITSAIFAGAICPICAAQGYRLPAFGLIQPVTAALIPPLAYVAFQITAVGRHAPRDGLHGLVPLFVRFCVSFAPAVLDQI